MGIKEEVTEALVDQDYRHSYAAEFLDMVVARQIRALRKQRKLTQEQLADLIGSGQSFISQIEDEEYGALSLKTLKDLARAFDTFLTVRFDSFSALVENVERTSITDLGVPSFTEDPFFATTTPVHIGAAVAGGASQHSFLNEVSGIQKLYTGTLPTAGRLEGQAPIARALVGLEPKAA